MSKDTGSWLSAQQAILPDGTEVENLPLINRKLPPLFQAQRNVDSEYSTTTQAAQNAALEAIKFAVQADNGIDFLRAWLRADPDAIRKEWPEAPPTVLAGN